MVSTIIEINKCIKKYEAHLKDQPKYIVCGSIHIGGEWYGGVLAYVQHRFWGQIICKVAEKYGGNYTVERTEFHKKGETYFDRCAEIFDSIINKVYGHKMPE